MLPASSSLFRPNSLDHSNTDLLVMRIYTKCETFGIIWASTGGSWEAGVPCAAAAAVLATAVLNGTP